MSLQYAQAVGSASWQLQQTNSGFLSTSQGPDSVQGSVVYPVTSGYATVLIAKQYAVASGATQTINLLAQTDLLNTTQSISRLYGLELVNSGSPVTLKPDASNGFNWFWASGSNGVSIPDGGFITYASLSSAAVVSGQHNLALGNVTSGTANIKLILIGGN